jgi:hypothetical protein
MSAHDSRALVGDFAWQSVEPIATDVPEVFSVKQQVF